MKYFSEYDDREKFLEQEMGIKGNYGNSNQSVYETVSNTIWSCGICVVLGIVLVIFGAIYETMKG